MNEGRVARTRGATGSRRRDWWFPRRRDSPRAFDFHMNPLAKHWSSSKNHQMKRRRKYNGWFGGERRRDF